MLRRMLNRARQTLRPYVNRLRWYRRRAQEKVRPSQPWNGVHDPVLLKFPPWRGEADGAFVHDFLGIKTDPRFKTYFKPDPVGLMIAPYPAPSQAYLELVFLLRSVVDACKTPERPFTMMELGAGYGPWLVTAHHAIQATSPRPVKLVGLEMSPTHFEYLQEHLRNNGIDPAQHTLIHGAISDVDGEAVFSPEPGAAAYGQKVRERHASDRAGESGQHAGTGSDEVRVPALSLRTLLADHERVDLLHIDVQGEEWRALEPVAGELVGKVKRVIVATHSRQIHRNVQGLFAAPTWEVTWDFQCRKLQETPYGDIAFRDGLLAATNRAL